MATILAIHAHPDDISKPLAAGTLALLGQPGALPFRIVTVTAGDCGSAEHDLAGKLPASPPEAANAAAMIGAGVPLRRCCRTSAVFNDDASRRSGDRTWPRWSGADIVLTASPVDYHPDHEATSLLVRDACFASTVPNYRTGPSAPLKTIPHLYFMDSIGGRDRDGPRASALTSGVDIGALMETKSGGC